MNALPPVLRPMAQDQFVLGIDPDLHHAGIALVMRGPDRKGICPTTAVAAAPSKTTSYTAAGVVGESAGAIFGALARTHNVGRIVVEGQRIYLGGKSAPEDIMHLAFAAGALLLAARIAWPEAEWWIVEPQAWTGSVPKEIHQARTRTRVAFDEAALIDLNGRHASHVTDAAGLAWFGLEETNRFKAGVYGSELPSVLAKATARAAATKSVLKG